MTEKDVKDDELNLDVTDELDPENEDADATGAGEPTEDVDAENEGETEALDAADEPATKEDIADIKNILEGDSKESTAEEKEAQAQRVKEGMINAARNRVVAVGSDYHLQLEAIMLEKDSFVRKQLLTELKDVNAHVTGGTNNVTREQAEKIAERKFQQLEDGKKADLMMDILAPQLRTRTLAEQFKMELRNNLKSNMKRSTAIKAAAVEVGLSLKKSEMKSRLNSRKLPIQGAAPKSPSSNITLDDKNVDNISDADLDKALESGRVAF